MGSVLWHSRIGLLTAALAASACGSDSLSDPAQNDGGRSGTGGGGSGASDGGAGGPCGSDTGPGEPNNGSEATAAALPSMSDQDPGTLPRIQGMVNGSSDVDWYTYTGSDDLLSLVDPFVALSSSTSLRVCTFFRCLALEPLITCPSGTTSAQSDSGKPGCCANASTTSFTVGDSYCGDTSGSNDESMQVFIRVDGPSLSATACAPYTVDYHF